MNKGTGKLVTAAHGKGQSLLQMNFIESHLTILLTLLSFLGFAYSSDGDTYASSNTTSQIGQKAKPYDTFNERKILSAAQQQQEVFQAKQAEIQSRIDSLQNEITTKLAEAKYAHESADALRLQFLDAKKLIPSDNRFLQFEGG